MVYPAGFKEEKVMTSLKIRRNFIATCLTVAALTISSPAFPILGSGKVVFDPANHVENIATALSTAAAASSLAKIFEEAIIINAGGINAFETFSNSVEMKQMIGILQATDQMQLALREGKKSFDNIQNVFGASPYKDWSNFASNIAARKSSGDAQAIMLYDSAYAADQQIRKAFEANKKIMQSALLINGPTKALQANINAVSALIDQNQAMLFTMSAQAKSQAHELSRQAQEREQKETSIKDYRDAARKAYEADARLINSRP